MQESVICDCRSFAVVLPILCSGYNRRILSEKHATSCPLADPLMTNDNASFWNCDNSGCTNDARDVFCENCRRGVRPEHSEIDDYLANTIVRELWNSQK